MIANRLEIRVNGLQRSGNHALVHWMACQGEGTSLVLSDAAAGTDPFRTMSEFLHYEDGQVVRYVETWDPEGLPPGGRRPAVIEYRDGQVASKTQTVDRERRLAMLQDVGPRRDVLIHTYEDTPLERADETAKGSLFGRSDSFRDVLVVRDPLNLFASRLQRWKRLTGISDRQKLVALWKQHAGEALGRTSRLGPGTVVANFTRWAGDGAYRRELAAALGLRFSDDGRSTMMPGFSSSFDGTQYRSCADRMAVNERWKAFADDPALAEILGDGEIRSLSDALFGPLDGWRAFS